MNIKSFINIFKNHCLNNNFEKSSFQKDLVIRLSKFTSRFNNKSSWLKRFFTSKEKCGYYIFGSVGVGKTMIINLYFEFTNANKKKFHFNQFMIDVHKYIHENQKKNNENQYLLKKYADKLKSQYELIFLDEFQVTNIVDAMILGNLFDNIIKNNIKVLITSNTSPENLYKDGLQRDQFKPFIKIMQKQSFEYQLNIDDDYRKSKGNKTLRYYSPLNQENNFKINKLFRVMTKDKVLKEKILNIKGRKFILKNFYDGIVRLTFKEVCDKNLGSEDYIKIVKNCFFIVMENIPAFNDLNSNQQQRFITFLDIVYDQNIPMAISAEQNIDKLTSSRLLEKPFKRTISRLYELTSKKYL